MNLKEHFRLGFEVTIEDGNLSELHPANKLRDNSYSKIIEEYLSGTRKDFSDVKVTFEGTELQKKVWDELKKIKRGEVISYEELANRVGTKAVRAVATAVGKNPIPLIVPCHRVVRKDGSIGKYSMGGSEVKRALLALEGVRI